MRAYAVPLAAVAVITALAGVTAYRDLGSAGKEEEVVHGFPSDIEAAEGAPVVRRNGASGPAPRFKAARSSDGGAPAPAPDPFERENPEGAPPEWLRATFDLLAALGLFGEREPERTLDDVERSGFETAKGRVTPGHDFSTPDTSAPGYKAQRPEYPGATDGSRTIRARATTPGPRGFSE